MTTVVVGTAGHIDHGKSALVRALTGTDPDRLKEEQARGITIDLGFAHLDVGGVAIALVDVPGHERFIRNMLAGAGGIDAVVLVIDAGEGVKPQTREHFDICRLLGVDRGIIALTKIDAASPAAIARSRAEAAALVAGSALAHAPVVAVSARSGEGMEELRQALARLGGQPARQDREGVVRVPIDRVFLAKGFGVVVTGTLVSGVVAPEDSLVILPDAMPVRVRGIQVHGQPAGSARAPQRAALNLAGVDASQLRRGQTLATRDSLAVTVRADVRLHLLADARPLKHGARVRVHGGSSEVFARVSMAATRPDARSQWIAARPGEAGVEVRGGGDAFARLRFESPTVLTRGDRLVLRSATQTIGGAQVLDPEPPTAGVRRASTLDRFRTLEAAADIPALLVAEAGARGLRAEDLVRRGGCDPRQAAAALASLVRDSSGVTAGDVVVAAAALMAVEQKVVAELTVFHAAAPRDDGMPRAALRARAAPRVSDDVWAAVTARLEARKLIRGADRVSLFAHQPAQPDAESELAARVESALHAGGLTPPDAAVLAGTLGVPAPEIERALQWLIRGRRVVRMGAVVFHGEPLARLRAEVASLRHGQPAGARVTLDVGAFKARYALTRKHAIPLLEWLDRERVTRRVGDERLVL